MTDGVIGSERAGREPGARKPMLIRRVEQLPVEQLRRECDEFEAAARAALAKHCRQQYRLRYHPLVLALMFINGLAGMVLATKMTEGLYFVVFYQIGFFLLCQFNYFRNQR